MSKQERRCDHCKAGEANKCRYRIKEVEHRFCSEECAIAAAWMQGTEAEALCKAHDLWYRVGYSCPKCWHAGYLAAKRRGAGPYGRN